MKHVHFVTGNPNKFDAAQRILRENGIALTQYELDIDEIQSEQTEKIALDKAQKAYDALQKPLLISDDSWNIVGLRGFPGPYMKSVMRWFEAEDFLRLTAGLEDKRVKLEQIVVYKDGAETKMFTNTITGTLLDTASDQGSVSWAKVVSLTADKRSLSDVRHDNPEQLARELPTVWHQVTKWLSSRTGK